MSNLSGPAWVREPSKPSINACCVTDSLGLCVAMAKSCAACSNDQSEYAGAFCTIDCMTGVKELQAARPTAALTGHAPVTGHGVSGVFHNRRELVDAVCPWATAEGAGCG